MEFNHYLTNDDFRQFVEEFYVGKNKWIFFRLNNGLYYWGIILSLLVTVFFCAYLYFVLQVAFYKYFFISFVFFFILLELMWFFKHQVYRLLKQWHITYFGKSLLIRLKFNSYVVGQVEMNNETIALFSEKKNFCFKVSSIVKIFETKSYYFFVINAGFGFKLPLIFSKRIIFASDFEREFREFVDKVNYKNNNELNIKRYMIYEIPKKMIGFEIAMVPVFSVVLKGSLAEKTGISPDDIIIEINDENVINCNQYEIADRIHKTNKLKIKVKKTQTGQVKIYEIDLNKSN